MKSVWILNHYAQEPSGPGGTRHHSLAKYLSRYGWEASIIAASVELNTGRQRLASTEAYRLEKYGDVPFLWIKTPTYQGNGLGRIVNMLAYTVRVLVPHYTSKLPRPDVIIGSSVHPFAAWAGAMLAKRYDRPFIFEVRDLWPQTLIDLRRISEKSIRAHLLRGLEKWLYRHAARILVLLPRANDYIEPLGISGEKIVWLPNGIDFSEFPILPPPVTSKVFVLMYFGAHGHANGLDNVLLAMAILRERTLPLPVHLRLIGDGPLKHALVQQAGRMGLTNVSFEPPVSRNRIPSLAAEADGFLFNLVEAEIFKYGVSSNKLFDFMAGARPIIFCSKAANNPVQEAMAGISLDPGDPWALADAVEHLLHMTPAERDQMGRNARCYVEKNHDYAMLAEKLAFLLESVSRQPASDSQR